MNDRARRTAEKFGILEKIEALERKLLEIPHVVEVEFDLDGFWSDIYQVILVPKYDVPASTPDYFQVRHEMVEDILQVARDFGLKYSGDTIEDMGAHLYIVRNCDATWKELVEQNQQGFAAKLVSATNRSNELQRCSAEQMMDMSMDF